MREYQRRHDKREQYAREHFGAVGGFLAKVIDEPQSTTAWKQGGSGEVRAGRRLDQLLSGSGVQLLHDRRVPRHGQANIDHIAVGPGGITVIDTKTHRGKIRTDWKGGLFVPRQTLLMIDGRDQTRLIRGVEKQVGWVRDAVAALGLDAEVDIRGVLCFPSVDGLPLLRRVVVDGVVVDGPKPVARLAARPGELTADEIRRLWAELGRRFPAA